MSVHYYEHIAFQSKGKSTILLKIKRLTQAVVLSENDTSLSAKRFGPWGAGRDGDRLSLGQREGSWHIAKLTGSMQTWWEGPREQQDEASLGMRMLLPEEGWHVALLGQGIGQQAKPGLACIWLGPAGVQAAEQRLQQSLLQFPGME